MRESPIFSNYHLRLFQYQVSLQCEIFTLHNGLLSEGLAEFKTKPNDVRVVVKIWASIQSMLTATANISKACWGKDAPVRRKLRESLGITEPSVLKDRNMRNHFDHIDEKIDVWWKTSKRHDASDLNIASEAILTTGMAQSDILRNFDPHTGYVIFFGERFNLYAAREEINRIFPNAVRALDGPVWP